MATRNDLVDDETSAKLDASIRDALSDVTPEWREAVVASVRNEHQSIWNDVRIMQLSEGTLEYDTRGYGNPASYGSYDLAITPRFYASPPVRSRDPPGQGMPYFVNGWDSRPPIGVKVRQKHGALRATVHQDALFTVNLHDTLRCALDDASLITWLRDEIITLTMTNSSGIKEKVKSSAVFDDPDISTVVFSIEVHNAVDKQDAVVLTMRPTHTSSSTGTSSLDLIPFSLILQNVSKPERRILVAAYGQASFEELGSRSPQAFVPSSPRVETTARGRRKGSSSRAKREDRGRSHSKGNCVVS